MKKPLVVGGAAIVVFAAAMYIGSSGVLQGRLSGVTTTKPTTTTVVGTTGSSSTSGKSKATTNLKNISDIKSGTTTTTTTTPLLSISAADASPMRQTVDISEVDFDYDYDPEDEFDVDPTWFAIGEFELVYDENVSNCTKYVTSLLMTDETSSAQYFDKVFADVRLQFRDSNKDVFMEDPYVYAEDGSSFGHYWLKNMSMTGDTYYFYVEGQAKPDVDASYLDKEYSIYLQGTCAEKDGTVYSWSDDDDTGQNSYFDADFDGKYGVLGGTVTVKE